MLTTLVENPFDEPWIYEIKWDGYQAIALIKKEKSILCPVTINLSLELYKEESVKIMRNSMAEKRLILQ